VAGLIEEGEGRPEGWALLRGPDVAFQRLERGEHVPRRVRHPAGSFATAGAGKLGRATRKKRSKGKTRKKTRTKARLESEDLIAYRSSCTPLLDALHDGLRAEEARTCLRVGDDLLLLSAAALPALREVVRALSDRFEVTIDAAGGD
jgi:hypothetical protein